MSFQHGMAGIFTVKKYRKGTLTFHSVFDNLITNKGLDMFGYLQDSQEHNFAKSMLRRLTLGTGSGSPEFGDLGVHSKVLSLDTQGPSSTGKSSVAPLASPGNQGHYMYVRQEWTILSTGDQRTFSEVSVGPADDSADYIWARQLFRNETGQVEALVQEPDEDLVIMYELRVFPPADSAFDSGTVTVNGTKFRAMWAVDWSSWDTSRVFPGSQSANIITDHTVSSEAPPVLPDNVPVIKGAGSSSVSWDDYSGNKKRRCVITWNGDSFNETVSIRGVAIPGIFGSGSGTPWIMLLFPLNSGGPIGFHKTADEQLSMVFEHTWDRR